MSVKCANCGAMVEAYARVEDPQMPAGQAFKPLCQACAMPLGAWQPEFTSKKRYVGPPAPANAICVVMGCNRAAAAACDTCAAAYCERHWWRHSHLEPNPFRSR